MEGDGQLTCPHEPAGLSSPASELLFRPPEGFTKAEIFKTGDHYGNLRLSLFARGGEWVVDADIDDAAELEHWFQVLRNTLTAPLRTRMSFTRFWLRVGTWIETIGSLSRRCPGRRSQITAIWQLPPLWSGGIYENRAQEKFNEFAESWSFLPVDDDTICNRTRIWSAHINH